MAKSTSEVGHAKNVENFSDLINFCDAYAGDYNPSKVSIQLASLQSTHTNAKNSLQNLNTANADYIVTINTRQQVFGKLKTLTTRILNALDASDVEDHIVRDAKTFVKKIQGRRTSVPKMSEPGEEVKIISASQMSYDQRLENFSKLVTLLKAVPEYTPNEDALQIASLETYLSELADANSAHSIQAVNVSNARNHRNHILYDTKTGLVHIASEVKKYVKSVFGAASMQFKQVRGLKFVQNRKK